MFGIKFESGEEFNEYFWFFWFRIVSEVGGDFETNNTLFDLENFLCILDWSYCFSKFWEERSLFNFVWFLDSGSFLLFWKPVYSYFCLMAIMSNVFVTASFLLRFEAFFTTISVFWISPFLTRLKVFVSVSFPGESISTELGIVSCF